MCEDRHDLQGALSDARNRKRQERRELGKPLPNPMDAQQGFLTFLLRSALDAAFELIDPDDAQLIKRHVCEGESLADLADELGWARSTAYRRLTAGLLSLRACLQDNSVIQALLIDEDDAWL